MNNREIVRRLKRLDTCAVSDAQDKLGLPNGAFGYDSYPGVVRKVAGRVITMRLRAYEESDADSKLHLGVKAIEAAKPGDIIVVQSPSKRAGAWGGLLSRAAKVQGVAAVFVDGAARDIGEAKSIGLPLWAASSTPRTARMRLVEASVNEGIMFQDHVVHPGGYIIADQTGFVIVAKENVDRVIVAAEDIARREAAMAVDIDARKSLREVLGTDYERMLDHS